MSASLAAVIFPDNTFLFRGSSDATISIDTTSNGILLCVDTTYPNKVWSIRLGSVQAELVRPDGHVPKHVLFSEHQGLDANSRWVLHSIRHLSEFTLKTD